MKTFASIVILSTILVACAATGQERTPSAMKSLVDSQNYIFRAETAVPQSGGTRMLSGGFDLRVSPEKITSYLPYFGRAYSPSLPSEGGIKFTSTEFDYDLKQNKERWEVQIKPRDAQETYILNLTIFDNGRASLQVTSTNRQAITFHGQVSDNPTAQEAK